MNVGAGGVGHLITTGLWSIVDESMRGAIFEAFN